MDIGAFFSLKELFSYGFFNNYSCISNYGICSNRIHNSFFNYCNFLNFSCFFSFLAIIAASGKCECNRSGSEQNKFFHFQIIKN